MNKVIIVGNGFDRHHDLPTDYNSFLTWYIFKVLESFLASRTPIEDLLSIRIQDCLETTTPTDDEYKNIYDWITGGDLRRKKAFFIGGTLYEMEFIWKSDLFRRLLQQSSPNTWVEIELEYYENLKECLKQYQFLYKIGKPVQPSYDRIEKLNNDLDIIKRELKEYLTIVTRDSIINKKYLSVMLEGIDTSTIHEGASIMEELDNIAVRSKIIKPDFITILNFNYTSISERLKLPSNVNVIDIHGSLTDDSNPMIFGYGDEVDEKYREMENTNFNGFLTQAKSMGYFQTKKYSDLMRQLYYGKYVVYIWGHACGLSDRTLLKSIFEHENCVQIKTFYWQKKDGSDNYTKIVQNISRHFDDKKIMRNRVANKEFCTPL